MVPGNTAKKGDVMSKLTGLVELVEEAIDKGTTAVEEVHKAIVNEPLTLLKKIEPLEKIAQGVQDVQDQIIGNVYGVIRSTNQKVSEIAKDMLKKVETQGKKMK